MKLIKEIMEYYEGLLKTLKLPSGGWALHSVDCSL